MSITDERAQASQWSAVRDELTTIVREMAALAGMETAPKTSFSSSDLGWSDSLAYYGAHGSDVVAVNLKVFAGPNALTDQQIRTQFEGALLHELGHRADRQWLLWAKAPRLPIAATVILGAPTLISALRSAPSTAWEGALWAAIAAVWALWVIVHFVVGRWLERRADDFMYDIGGVDRGNAGLDLIKATSRGDGSSRMHMSVQKRRQRQLRRLGVNARRPSNRH